MSWIAKTLTDVAQFFDVAHGTAKEWRRNGMPGNPGAFDLAAIYRWLRDRRDASPTTAAATIDAKKALEVRRLEEDIRARERENDKEEGQLIDRRQVESELAIAIIDARKIFEQLPAKLTPMLPREFDSVITAEVRRLIYSALNELGDRMAVIAPRARRVAEILERLDRSSPAAASADPTATAGDAAGLEGKTAPAAEKPATKTAKQKPAGGGPTRARSRR